MRLRFLVFLATVFASAPSFAATVAELKAYFDATQTGSYEFRQTAVDQNGFLVNSGGSLTFQRPDRFRVEYQFPDKLEIVSNGDDLWIHDIALNQVLVAKQGEVPSFQGFLAILTAGRIGNDLKMSTEKGPDGVRDWLVLTPIDPDDLQFKTVAIAFNQDGQLTSVRVVNLLNAEVSANFFVLDAPVPQPQEFEFVIPSGAEIIRESN